MAHLEFNILHDDSQFIQTALEHYSDLDDHDCNVHRASILHDKWKTTWDNAPTVFECWEREARKMFMTLTAEDYETITAAIGSFAESKTESSYAMGGRDNGWRIHGIFGQIWDDYCERQATVAAVARVCESFRKKSHV